MVDAPSAWPYSTGEGVTIAIVDTGVDLNHPDLAGKILPGHHFYTDASHRPHEDDNTQDDNGHGTHVAGIAAASGNNSIGVAGMAWNAQILPVKVVDSNGNFYVSDAAKGLVWAADRGAEVINFSWGSDIYSHTLEDATTYVYSKGSLVVAAAGNCANVDYRANGCQTRNPPYYPAASPHVIGVAATDANDSAASFSESGNFIYVSAPGVDVLSTYWSGPTGSTYWRLTGTSMAAPMVSGLAALIWSVRRTLTNDQVAGLIAETAVDLGTPGYDVHYGHGRIDVGTAVHAAILGQLSPQAPAGVPAFSTPPAPAADRPYRPGAVLVRLKPGALAAATTQATFEAYGARSTGMIPSLGIQMLEVTPGSERQTAAALRTDLNVEFAEPDYPLTLSR